MEYFSVLEKKEILSYATAWMNLDDIMLSGRGAEPITKAKYWMIPLIGI